MLFWIGTLKKLLLGSVWIFLSINFIYSLSIISFSDLVGKSLAKPEKIKEVEDYFITDFSITRDYVVVSTFYRGIYVFDFKKRKGYFLTKKEGLVYNSIRKIVVYKNYLAGFYIQPAGGVFVYNMQTKKLSSYSDLNVLDSSYIKDITFFKGYLYILTAKMSSYSMELSTGEYEKWDLKIKNPSFIKWLNLEGKLYLLAIEDNLLKVWDLTEAKKGLLQAKKIPSSIFTFGVYNVEGEAYIWGIKSDFSSGILWRIFSGGKLIDYSYLFPANLKGVTTISFWYKRLFIFPFKSYPLVGELFSKNLKEFVVSEIPFQTLLVEKAVPLSEGILLATTRGMYFLPKNFIFKRLNAIKEKPIE